MPSANRMTTADRAAATGDKQRDANAVVADLIRFLETGIVPERLFAADAFADLSLPHWRVQAATAAEIIAIRAEGHPCPGRCGWSGSSRPGTASPSSSRNAG